MIGKVFKSAFLLLMVCLCAVSFAGCSNMPREKEIKKILSQTDPYIKAELAPALGLDENDITISEAYVGISRVAEYKFTVGDKTYNAQVTPFGTRMLALTDYYSNDFYEKISEPFYEYIKEADFFSGCEYTVNRFLFSVKPYGWHNYNLGAHDDFYGMLPLTINPDNMADYIGSAEITGLTLRIELDYYGAKDKVIPDEALYKLTEVFPPLQSFYIDISHFGSEGLSEPDNYLEKYSYYSNSNGTGIQYTEFAYRKIADGVMLCLVEPVSPDLKAFIDNNTLFVNIPVSMESEIRLYVSPDFIPKDGKYYIITTDSDGTKKETEQTWLTSSDTLYLSPGRNYRIPLKLEQ